MNIHVEEQRHVNFDTYAAMMRLRTILSKLECQLHPVRRCVPISLFLPLRINEDQSFFSAKPGSQPALKVTWVEATQSRRRIRERAGGDARIAAGAGAAQAGSPACQCSAARRAPKGLCSRGLCCKLRSRNWPRPSQGSWRAHGDRVRGGGRVAT